MLGLNHEFIYKQAWKQFFDMWYKLWGHRYDPDYVAPPAECAEGEECPAAECAEGEECPAAECAEGEECPDDAAGGDGAGGDGGGGDTPPDDTPPDDNPPTEP